MTERRIAILRDIYRMGEVTASVLAHKYGVSKRTIMRDIDYLSLNNPILMTRGRGGGIRLLKSDYVESVRKRELNQAVLEKIIEQHQERGWCKLDGTEVTRLMRVLTLKPIL